MSAIELLAPHEARPENPRWHELRRAGVSASEIAAILGLSKWNSAFGLYWQKIEGWDAEPNDDMTVGTIVEPAVADLWAHHCDPHENLILAHAGLYAHRERVWQLATPDRLVHDTCSCCATGCGGSCSGVPGACSDCRNTQLGGPPHAALECKWAASWDGWGEDGTDQIPVYYRAQILWQCDVLGVDQWYLGVLGPAGFRHYSGRLDRAALRDLELMRREGARFHRRLIEQDPPPIDDGHPGTIAALKRLHPTVEPGEVETTPEFANGWRRARALRKRAEALCARYEARARHDLGHYHRLVLPDGRLVASRSVFDQPGDTAELTAMETDRPTTDRLNYGKALTHGT